VGQVAIGVVFFLAVAGLLLYWSAGESSTGNRIFLWVMAGFALVLATWRIAIGVLLIREGRSHRRAIRGL
jgi:apolipoprotein N-acyltransferase